MTALHDLGLASVDDAVAAARAGTVIRMDLGVAGDRCFVNTLSFGGYTQVVDAHWLDDAVPHLRVEPHH